MDVSNLLGDEASSLAAKRVFGEPLERDGTVVIPAAVVRGGGGGSEGKAREGKQPEGSGLGFGLSARPVGAFVLRQGKVRWRPAIDVNRIVLGAQIVAIVALLTARAIRSSRRSVVRARRLGRWRALHLVRGA